MAFGSLYEVSYPLCCAAVSHVACHSESGDAKSLFVMPTSHDMHLQAEVQEGGNAAKSGQISKVWFTLAGTCTLAMQLRVDTL